MSRKRIRSSECPYYQKTKQFISQQIVDQHNPKKMSEIHKKTVSLLFKGINNHFNNNNNNNNNNGSEKLIINEKDFYRTIQFQGYGKYSILGDKGVNKMQPTNWLSDKPDRLCLSCSKQSKLHTYCTCCNLELCEHCGISCNGECKEPLCINCVNLFDCGTIDNPICNRCKYYQ